MKLGTGNTRRKRTLSFPQGAYSLVEEVDTLHVVGQML